MGVNKVCLACPHTATCMPQILNKRRKVVVDMKSQMQEGFELGRRPEFWKELQVCLSHLAQRAAK